MKIKKIISYLLVSLLLFTGIKFTLATETLTYEKAKELAEQYITNSLEDEMWKNNNPHITAHKYFYTDSETKASYIEFKVSCDNAKDCWFVLVNIDWDDVAIPIASPSGVWPGEILSLKLNEFSQASKKADDKLYYFSPFEQYIENKVNDEIISIKAEDNIDSQLETFKKEEQLRIKTENDLKNWISFKDWLIKKFEEDMTKEEFFIEMEELEKENLELEKILSNINVDDKVLEIKKLEIKEWLKEKLANSKTKAKEFKKTREFKEQKNLIEDQILTIPDTKFIMENLDFWYASYNSPWESNEYVDWRMYYNNTCHWKTPCLVQTFEAMYCDKNDNRNPCVPIKCNVAWCVPTALWIIFWYYANRDMLNWFPKWWKNTKDIEREIAYLWKLIWTTCDKTDSAGTQLYRVEDSLQYLKLLWYANSKINYYRNIGTDIVFNKVKEEIKESRPILIAGKEIKPGIIEKDLGKHAFVWFWYKATTGSQKIVRINAWIWNFWVDGWSAYYYSNIDLNLDSMYMTKNEYVAYWYATFKIQ